MSELKKTGSETNIATSVDVSNAVSGVAHLSGNETFTGTKTFNNTIYVGDGSSSNMMLTSGDIRKMTNGTVKTYSFPASAGTLELQGHTHNELDAYYTKLLVVDDGTGGLITRENVEKGFKLGPISVTDPSNNSLHLEITIGIPIKVSQFSNDDSLYSTGSIWLQIRDVDNSVDIVSWQEAAIDHTKDNAGKNFFLSSGITINPYYSFPQYDWSEYLQTAPFTITKNNDNTFYFTESWGPISTYQNNLQSETWITNTAEQIETVNDVDGKLGAYAKNNHTHTNITWDTIQTTAYLNSISDNAGMDTIDVYGIDLESSTGKPAMTLGYASSGCNLCISLRTDDGISLIRKNLSDRRIYKYDGIHDVKYGTYGHDFALQFPAITANETIATLSDINSIDGFVPYANSSLKSVVLGSGVSTGTGSLALVSANALGNGSIAMGTSAVSAYGTYTIAMGAGTTMTSGTMGTFAHGNSVSAIGRGCHAEGRATIAGSAVTTFAAHSEGWNTSAFANYSHTEGVHVGIPSADKFAYAWNGVSAASASGGYSSHGEGTFNINPSGGLDGFYIGDAPLSTTLATYQTTAGMSDYQPVSAMTGYASATHTHSYISGYDISLSANPNSQVPAFDIVGNETGEVLNIGAFNPINTDYLSLDANGIYIIDRATEDNWVYFNRNGIHIVPSWNNDEDYVLAFPQITANKTIATTDHTHSDYVSKSATAAQVLHSSISTTLSDGEIKIESSATGGGVAGLYASSSDGYVWVGVGSSQSWLQKDRIGYTTDGNTQTELMFPARTSSDEVKTIATTDEANLIKVLNLYVDETTPTTAFEMDSSVGWYRGCIGSDGVLPTLDWSKFSMPANSVYQCTLALRVNSSATTLTEPSGISWVTGAGLPTSSFAGHWMFISLIREGWEPYFTQAAVWRVL